MPDEECPAHKPTTLQADMDTVCIAEAATVAPYIQEDIMSLPEIAGCIVGAIIVVLVGESIYGILCLVFDCRLGIDEVQYFYALLKLFACYFWFGFC